METGDGAPLGADPSVTVECWFRLGTGGVNQVLVSKREDPLGGGSSTGLSVWVGSDDRVKASWGLGSTSVVLSADAAPALGLGDAHHVAAIWDADVETVRICLDGVEEASLIVSNAVLALDDSPLVLGNSTEAPWWPLQGVIDEVHITTRDDLFTTGAVQTAAHYADWAWQTFDLATLSAGSGNREGDADNDAFSNGQEQLFAGDPTNAMVGPVPLALDLSGGTGLTYDRLPDGVFRVHYSTNLQVWLDVTQGFGPDTIFDNGNGTESVRFMGAAHTGMSDSVFYRIRGDWQDTYVSFTVTVFAVSSQYNSTFPPANSIDGSLVESTDTPRHYWLAADGLSTGHITYDFSAPFELTQIRLANTHNTTFNDRGSKGYQIIAGNGIAGGVVTGGTVLATGDLADGIGGTPPAGNATFETVWTGSEPAVRYATVEITSRADWAGAGIGLNEVEFTVATP